MSVDRPREDLLLLERRWRVGMHSVRRPRRPTRRRVGVSSELVAPQVPSDRSILERRRAHARSSDGRARWESVRRVPRKKIPVSDRSRTSERLRTSPTVSSIRRRSRETTLFPCTTTTLSLEGLLLPSSDVEEGERSLASVDGVVDHGVAMNHGVAVEFGVGDGDGMGDDESFCSTDFG